MDTSDKVENKGEEIAGRIKELMGDLTDDEKLRDEGEAEKRTAKLKQAGENVKDAFRG
ncbi:MAG TPA: CsbD family protein [Terrimesophilobacter sp.]|nr:CsbD family protein [Terrimesophilobacter sp.]HRP99529.1 CsbD family protein [Terrimesophilobacter sp.]